MKYGYNDREWNNGKNNTNVCKAISDFNLHGFIPYMKRKTYNEEDEEMINALLEMVTMMKEHVEELKNK